MRQLNMKERDDLEHLVDIAGVGTLLSAIGEICFEKAEHIAANYQDRTTAKVWRIVGTRLTNFANKLDL